MITTTIDFKEYYNTRKFLIDEHLKGIIPESAPYHAQLFEAARYSLIASSKRIRPLFALAVAETYGADPKEAVNTASALELIHTYSLIHDDLPCMDDDDFRRGKPTLHRVFKESEALLAGDYLLTKAFEIIAKDLQLSSDKKVDLIRILAECAGGDGMIGGQIMDLDAEEKSVPLSVLEIIHQKKTASMLVASIQFGAFIGNAPAHDWEHLTAFGYNIGLAFQIIDDVLDEIGTFEEMGKSPCSDKENHKSTFVTLLGIEGAKEKGHEHLTKAKKHLEALSTDSKLLVHLAEFAVNRRF